MKITMHLCPGLFGVWHYRLARIAMLVVCVSSQVTGAQAVDPNAEYLRLARVVYAKLEASSLLNIQWNTVQMRVVPEVAPANVPRLLFIKLPSPACAGDFYYPVRQLDLSTLSTGLVQIASLGPFPYSGYNTLCSGYFLPVPYFYYEITPGMAGVVKISYSDASGTALETTMTTTPVGNATPRFDINGMWYDTASDGSGISMHQAANNGSATLGTWFMFDKQGATRWYSLQASSWIAADTLEGVFIEASAPCAAGMACPAKADVLTPTYIFRIVFQSATVATAEVHGAGGALLFKSDLRRLQL